MLFRNFGHFRREFCFFENKLPWQGIGGAFGETPIANFVFPLEYVERRIAGNKDVHGVAEDAKVARSAVDRGAGGSI